MVNTFLKAGVGIGAVEAVNQVPPLNTTIEIAKLLIQFVIGVFSIYQIKKQNKKI